MTFAGVPSGQVESIELWKKDPSFVRVRIHVNPDVPVLQGTTASIQGVGFTGVSEILLDGAVKGAPPIACPEENSGSQCPEGVPVIPTKTSGFGALLSTAPQLIERLTTLTERLTDVLSEGNQKHIAGILKNIDGITGEFAKQGPDITKTLTQARLTLESATRTADQLTAVAANANGLINQEGRPMIADLRKSIASASKTMEDLQQTMADVRPGVQQPAEVAADEFLFVGFQHFNLAVAPSE